MTWLHVPSDLLDAFVQGDVSEEDAVRVALHVDDCAACQARAVAADPLATTLASASKLSLPDSLVQGLAGSVMADLERRASVASPVTPVAGIGLVAAAALVLLTLGDSSGALIQLQTLWHAALAVLRAVDIPLSVVTPVWLVAAVIAIGGAGLASWRLEQGLSPWR